MRSASARCSLGVEAPEAAGEHGGRAGLQRGLVGSAVNAARQTGYDEQPRLAELPGQGRREALAERRGVARADDGDRRTMEAVGRTAKRQDGRGAVDRLQQTRIIWLAERHEPTAGMLEGRNLRRDLPFIGGPDDAPTLARQVRQGVQHGAGAAMAVDERPEGAWPDRFGPEEAQPVEPLSI